MISTFLKDKQELKNLPAELQELAADLETTGKINKIIGDFKLDKEQEGRLAEVVLSVIKGEVNLYDAPSAIEEKIKVDFDTALDIDTALYENIFSAVEDILEAQYAAHKKPVAAPIPVVQSVDIEKAKKEKIDFTSLINKAAVKFNLFAAAPAVIASPFPSVIAPVPRSLQSEVGSDSEAISLKTGSPRPVGARDDTKKNDDLKSRFYEIADSFLSGARTKTQFNNTLTKDVASGGLAMDKKTADSVAEFLASYSRIQNIEAKKQGSALASTPPTASPHSVPPRTKITVNPEPPKKSSFTKVSEDKEVKQMAQQVDVLKTTSKKLLSVTEGVTKALAELNLVFPSAEMNDRLKLICDSRVRSVRNSIQTFEILTQPVASGGLGLNKEEADRISLVLNKYLEDKNKDIYGSKVAEIKQAEETEKKQWEEKQQAETDARKRILDEKFTKLTGKEIPLSPSLQKGEKGATTHFVPLPPPKIPSRAVKEEPSQRKKFPGIFGFVGKIFPVFKKEALAPQPRKILSVLPLQREEKLPPPLEKEGRGGFISASTTFPPKPSPRPASQSTVKSFSVARPVAPQYAGDGTGVAPEISAGRPVLEDIKYTPKLFGPLEEISRMTLDDFRKLSGDPKEAMLKIKDKLSLLREESFRKYQQGIEAWQKSPVYAEFLKILEQGLLFGVPLGDLLAKSKTLTQDEFDAIIGSRIGD